MTRSITLALLSLGTVCLAACGPKPGGPPGGMAGAPAPVSVIVARTEPVALTTELNGRTSAFLVSEVRPQVSGIVKARLFKEGALVRAGQPLYQIEPATYQTTYASAAAAVAQAQASYETARLKAERYRDLVQIKAVSQQDNDDAQAAARQGAANIAVQRAALDAARINLGWTKVLSPISGRIGKSAVTPGALVTASQTTALATVQALDRIYVDVTETSVDLLKLRRALATGQVGATPQSAQVRLILEDGTEYPLTGQLEFSDITVDPGTGTVGLRAVFPNPDGVLLPGMYVRARLSKGVTTQATLAPQTAVSRDASGQATAYVVGTGAKAELRPIQVAETIGRNWVVTSGLKPGDQLIVDGLQRLRPGAPVKPVVVGAQR